MRIRLHYIQREAVFYQSKRLFHRGQMNIPNHLPHINPKFVICRKIINSILVSPPNLSDMPIAIRHSIHFMGISRLQFGILIVESYKLIRQIVVPYIENDRIKATIGGNS